MFHYQQSQRQELIEFRNYVRQMTSAKVNQDKSPQKIKNPTKQLEFILKSTQLQQSIQKPINNVQITRPNYDYPRSASQTFVHFDANTWNENANSISRVKTIPVNVSELVRISNALTSMGKKRGQWIEFKVLQYRINQVICIVFTNQSRQQAHY